MLSVQYRRDKGGDWNSEQDTNASAESLQQFHDDKLTVQQLQQRSLIGYEQQNGGQTAADIGENQCICHGSHDILSDADAGAEHFRETDVGCLF